MGASGQAAPASVRVGYLAPEGTYTHEAMLASAASTGGVTAGLVEVGLPTIHEIVMAVHDGLVDRAVVPIENSVEGSVNATVDALAFATEDVVITGEVVQPIHHCLIARHSLALEDIEVVVSHPQANAQCARFLRERVRRAQVQTAASTAESVRIVVAHDGPWAALGPRIAAERHGGVVLAADVEDMTGNETRFAWLARHDGPAGVQTPGDAGGTYKTAIMFWPPVADRAGWLVDCLREFADRDVNLNRIESRPRKVGLGEYVFFVDLTGALTDEPVRQALTALRAHVQGLRVLGSFPAA